MSIRATTEQPKKWAVKAPEYVQEAKLFGIEFVAPNINESDIHFKIKENKIYFGLASIRDFGSKLCEQVLTERKANGEYTSLLNFIERIRPNTKVLEALTYAGALDIFHHSRESILENIQEIAYYCKKVEEYEQREKDIKERNIQNSKTIELQEELKELIKQSKEKFKKNKKDTSLLSECELFLLDKNNLKLLEEEVEYEEEWKNTLKKYLNLKKSPELKSKEFPIFPKLEQNTKKLTINEIMKQADYIGCYLTKHPARMVFPETVTIDSVTEGNNEEVAGAIIETRVMRTKRNDEMAILTIGDSTEIAKIVLFPFLYKKYKDQIDLSEGTILKIYGSVKKTDPSIEIVPNAITQYRSVNE